MTPDQLAPSQTLLSKAGMVAGAIASCQPDERYDMLEALVHVAYAEGALHAIRMMTEATRIPHGI